MMRVLDRRSHVAICITQIVSQRVRGQEVKAAGEAFVQRGLKGVVEHLKLRKVQRQDVAQVGQDVEVRSTKIAGGIREVGVQRLKRLVQVTDLMIPQVICTRADVSDLCDPVLRELVLNSQIPL